MSEERDKSEQKQRRRSRVLENMKLSGKEKSAAAVMGNLFIRFGPETQDRIAELYLMAIRQDHFREEVMGVLVPLGVKLRAKPELPGDSLS